MWLPFRGIFTVFPTDGLRGAYSPAFITAFEARIGRYLKCDSSFICLGNIVGGKGIVWFRFADISCSRSWVYLYDEVVDRERLERRSSDCQTRNRGRHPWSI